MEVVVEKLQQCHDEFRVIGTGSAFVKIGLLFVCGGTSIDVFFKSEYRIWLDVIVFWFESCSPTHEIKANY